MKWMVCGEAWCDAETSCLWYVERCHVMDMWYVYHRIMWCRDLMSCICGELSCHSELMSFICREVSYHCELSCHSAYMHNVPLSLTCQSCAAIFDMSHACPMPHIRMSHVSHVNESCHTYDWVMSHIWMGHVTHMNESCHTYEWVMAHIWMSHVSHMNESCHTYEWVMSHI